MSDDYSNGISTTAGITFNSPVTGEIESLFDEDWFRVQLEAGVPYMFSAQSTTLDRTLLALLDSTGSTIKSNWQWSSTEAAAIGHIPDVSGTYYLSVSDEDHSSTGRYTLQAELTGTTDDYSAGVNTTGVITPGSSKTGDIEIPSDEDWFRVSLTAGNAYVFSARSNDGIVFMDLYNSAGEYRRYDYQGSLKDSALISFDPMVSGDYYLAISYLDDGKVGSYELEADFRHTSDDYSSNMNTTGSVSPDRSASGRLEIRSDHDWFKVDLIAGTSYLLSAQSSMIRNVYLALYDSERTWIASEWQRTAAPAAEIEFTPTVSGPYYMGISSLGSDSTGFYSLEVDITSGGVTADDYSAGSDTTGVVTLDGPASGSIETATDQDWFKVSLLADTSYQLSATSTLDATWLGLKDSSGNWIGTDYQLGLHDAAMIGFTPETSGDYYLAVGDPGASTGNYTVSLALNGTTDDYYATVDTAGALSLGSPATGRIEMVGDEDWFEIQLIAGMDYRFSAQSNNLETTYLQLKDSQGQWLASGFQGNSENAAAISYTPAEVGTYYLAVSDLGGDTTGDYQVSLALNNASDEAADSVPLGVTAPTEGDSNHTNHFLLQLSAPLLGDASVHYTTRDGTALAGSDYVATSGVATIKAGETSVLLSVEIIADAVAETDESFYFVLTNPHGASFADGALEISAARTIIDDDAPLMSANRAESVQIVGHTDFYDGLV